MATGAYLEFFKDRFCRTTKKHQGSPLLKLKPYEKYLKGF